MIDALSGSLGLAFVAGLSGSAHCVGMCGALVLTVGREAGARALPAQLVYALGRILAYGMWGGVFGLLGGVVVVHSILSGISGWLFVLAGLSIILMAGARLGPWGEFTPGASLGGRLYQSLRGWLPVENSLALFFLLGALNSLVPCGLLATMELRAAASGSAVHGTALMLAFGLGTAPALVGLGAAGGRLSQQRRFRLDRAGSGVLILMGIQIVAHGARHLGWFGAAPPACH